MYIGMNENMLVSVSNTTVEVAQIKNVYCTYKNQPVSVPFHLSGSCSLEVHNLDGETCFFP